MAVSLIVVSARNALAQQHLFASGPTKYTYFGCNDGRSCHTFELFIGVPNVPTAPGVGSSLGAAWKATNTFYEPGSLYWYWYLDDWFNSDHCYWFDSIGTCSDDPWGTSAPTSFYDPGVLISWPLYGFNVPAQISPNIFYVPAGGWSGGPGAENTTVIMPLVSVTVLPEPHSLTLAAAGLLAVALVARARSRRSSADTV